MMAGTALCATGAGCSVGGPLVIASADYGGSGLNQIVHGSPQPTLAGQLGGPRVQQFEEQFVESSTIAFPAAQATVAIQLERAATAAASAAATTAAERTIGPTLEELGAARGGGLVDDVAGGGVGAAGREATGFRGSRGAPLRNAPYQPAQNLPTTIGGRQYTGHALDQMRNRGLMPSVVEDAIANGARSAGRGGATIFTTDQARVVLSADGSVTTVNPL
jgi:hypothetical protein